MYTSSIIDRYPLVRRAFPSHLGARVACPPNKQLVLLCVLLASVRLMHPIAPFITEEIFRPAAGGCRPESKTIVELSSGGRYLIYIHVAISPLHFELKTTVLCSIALDLRGIFCRGCTSRSPYHYYHMQLICIQPPHSSRDVLISQAADTSSSGNGSTTSPPSPAIPSRRGNEVVLTRPVFLGIFFSRYAI